MEIRELCNECQLDQIYDLSKTDWVEIDIPVVVESSLMKLFSTLRKQFPHKSFYMGFRDVHMCFSTDQMGAQMSIEDITKILKPEFKLKEDSLFQKMSYPHLDYLIIKYQKNVQDDILISQNFKLSYQNTQVLQLMKDQVQLILQSVTLDTQNDIIDYFGTLSLIQSGIDLSFQIIDNQKQTYSTRQFILNMDKNHSLSEFIYTFQKMGVSIIHPVIKGIEDYKEALVDHILIQIENQTNQIQTFTINFILPNFANMPEMYLRQVTGNLQILFSQNDMSLAQTYMNINGLFTFEKQNYYANIVRKAFENTQINILEETKIFPENSQIVPIRETMISFAKFISISPHSSVFPIEQNYQFIQLRLGISQNKGIISNPHIKLINQPLRVLKITGSMTSFNKDDSSFEALQTSLNGDLAVTSTVSFEGNQASNALWQIFNFQKLSRRDKLEINAFKILSLKLISNNIDLNQYDKILGQKAQYLDKGIQIQLSMELKKFCQADIFCMILTKFYGSMFEYKFSGNVHPIERRVTLTTQLQDINFNERYLMNDCFLNLLINYEDLDKPDIDLYISGVFKGEIQQNVSLKFKSKIQLTDEGILKLKGEMNDIFVNAFNLNNMLNMTQMTLLTKIDQEGKLSDLEINGIGVFGDDCYKISTIPEIFNNSNPVPLFSSKQQQQLLSLLNQSFINEDKCETANIIMDINPSDYKENYFKGKLNLLNLKQFYHIFFAGIADKLTSITPDNVRDQSIINHQVDLVYEPGQVYINGVELMGAFNFNGLLDFHGLVSSVRIVMDPDYQKYLYFTIVLPSFSLSQENIKFLSPLEYIEVLDDGVKAILNAFGAPKIEIQIPIENLNSDFIKFNMRGVVSIFGIQQLITAEIDNQKMTFQLQGNPFQGIYNSNLRVTTIISSGHMSENMASIFGQFENDQNLRQIENYLNTGIKQWYSTGLQYLQAWRDRISSLQQIIENIKDTTYCDPKKCSSYSQCSSNLIIECQKYQQEYECARFEDVCTDLQQKCTKVENVCARKYQGSCLSQVEVCTEWTNICIGYNQKICKRFRLKPEVKSNQICNIYDLSCNMESRIDQDCFMHCTQMQENYDQYTNLLKTYQQILNYSTQVLGNLTRLQSDYAQSEEDEKSFVNIRNMTMDGLMDEYLVPQNTNISLEISYNSPIDHKNRLIRTSIDFQSTSETSKKIIAFVLEDLCNIYGIPGKLATRLNQIIEDIEGSIRVIQRNKNMSQEDIKTKFDEIIHSQGLLKEDKSFYQQNKQAVQIKDRVSLVEKRLNQLMMEQQMKLNKKIEIKSSGLKTEKLSNQKFSKILNENQIYTLSEFLLDK